MFAELIERLRRHEDLSEAQAAAAISAIMRGEAAPAQVAGLLVGLAMKGERPVELVGLATAMRDHAVALPEDPGPVVDTCGTGGDKSGSFNISTAAALVVAACGVRVAKHGNRSVSSRCGSADVLQALGIDVQMTPAVASACLARAGMTFLFAPTFHPAMRHAAQARRELGVRTAFNLLGPLTNPARPRRQVVGVPRPELTELLARTLLALGTERAWVVHGADGLDELSTTGHTKVSEVRDGAVRTFYVHPADFGITRAAAADLAGDDAAANAAIIRRVLAGDAGAARDVVLLNAGAALLVAGAAGSVREGMAMAAAAIDSGGAGRVLESLVATSTAAGARRDDGNHARPARRHRRRHASARRRRREREPDHALTRRAEDDAPPARFRDALAHPGRVNVIAEFKRRSPSRGVLRAAYDPVAIAREYAGAGAAALSILTEPTFFDGSLDHLAAVREAVALPLLRKDFIVDEYQLIEAVAAGADAVLLIVAALDDRTLSSLHAAAGALGLAVLVEVHTDEELDRALAAGAAIVGVNNRNLRTLEVDVALSERLAARLPASVVAVSESGLRTAADVARLGHLGYRAFLVGERFMTSPSPGEALAGLLAQERT